MSDDSDAKPPTVMSSSGAWVVRGDVPAGLPYADYKQYLRRDFLHTCGYCTISESEAQAIRFTIDHYEPRGARPDLENEYRNLMYSCDGCNTLKGDRCPPPEAREVGHRFYRPDEDSYEDHFQRNGLRLKSKTNVGEFSLEALDLNRQSLRRLRDIRDRLTRCDRLVAEGVFGLRKFHIDQLPPHVKGRARSAINRAESVATQLVNKIDRLLADYAHSELIDPDPESEGRAKERAANRKRLEALFPGQWSAGKGR
jgi:hypothetical protein